VVMNSHFVGGLGASTGILGLIGAQVGYLLKYWVELGIDRNKRQRITSNIVLLIVLSFTLGRREGVDDYAHFGGLIAGFFVALIISNNNDSSRRGIMSFNDKEKKFMIAGGLGYLLFVGVWSAFLITAS
jgi:membrane associated rhomboid family serine protease